MNGLTSEILRSAQDDNVFFVDAGGISRVEVVSAGVDANVFRGSDRLRKDFT